MVTHVAAPAAGCVKGCRRPARPTSTAMPPHPYKDRFAGFGATPRGRSLRGGGSERRLAQEVGGDGTGAHDGESIYDG
jgi:hypothetical protein